MNKKYMDFVPTTAAKRVKKQPTVAVVEAKKKQPENYARAEVNPEVTKKVVEKKEMVAKPESLNELSKKDARLKIPKPAFVNTEKVRKRPLSKNVYQKKVVVPKEEPSAPVTIINKPEKDSKVGLIVAIILTIILGAAAGTVAFLLLPK